MFSQSDCLQIQQKGLTVDIVNQQINFFEKGVPHLNIVKPAVSGDGIFVPGDDDIRKFISEFEKNKEGKRILKFVPASGAATRMFKALYEFLAKPPSAIIADDVAQVINKIQFFAFYDELKDFLKNRGEDLPEMLKESSYHDIIGFILNSNGLNYGSLPKGLLKFHYYEDGSRTPLEEHLVEGALYAKNYDGSVVVHFTVSPEHIEAFSILSDNVKSKYEKEYGVKFFISFSVQKSSTDTIAVDGKNNPFRNSDGTLVFRPGGHGALLDNLDDLQGDIIFLKNIDNVVPDKLKTETVTYKKVLAGLLFDLQKSVFNYLIKLDKDDVTEELLNDVTRFIESNLGYRFSPSMSTDDLEKRKLLLRKILNRPIRVCGMVKNTGEPGGGPFWVKNLDGSTTLQILESSQFNLEEEQHRQAYKNATHFNPVDIVISTVDYLGRKFALKQYCDPNTGFISLKSKDGKELKALELPGLWNGAMAFWNTVFVEVPMITFNPVKSINDLLRTEHQNSKK